MVWHSADHLTIVRAFPRCFIVSLRPLESDTDVLIDRTNNHAFSVQYAKNFLELQTTRNDVESMFAVYS